MLRIGVDVSVFAKPRAGIVRYLHNMLMHLTVLDSGVHFTLYSGSPVDVSLPSGNWHLRTDSGIRGRVGSLWLQEVCPRWMAEDRLDLFWGQNYMLPLRLRRPCLRLLTVHDVAAVLCPWSMPLRRRLNSRVHFRRAIQAADHVVAVSKATAELTRVCFGIDAREISVVYEGCEASLMSATEAEERAAMLRELNLRPGYLLTVSTVEPRKDHVVLLNAIEQTPDAPLLVIVGGRGWKCESIMRRIRAMEEHGRVRYLGRVADDDLPALYSAAKLMIYPSLYEGFGLPVLEAMACGCPVLCSWSSSLPEVGGSAARYFRTHDAHDLALKLRELLADDVELERMVAEGRKQVAKFSFRKAAEQVMDIIKDLACGI